MSTKTCMVVLDQDSNVRFFCPEAMARAIAAQPGTEVTQDDDYGFVVVANYRANVLLDLHI